SSDSYPSRLGLFASYDTNSVQTLAASAVIGSPRPRRSVTAMVHGKKRQRSDKINYPLGLAIANDMLQLAFRTFLNSLQHSSNFGYARLKLPRKFGIDFRVTCS